MANRRGPGDEGSSNGPARTYQPSSDEEGRLYDEPVRLIRPKRLAIGLILILLGIIWLALDTYFGATTVPVTPSSHPAPVGVPQGAPQRTEGLSLNVRLLQAATVPGWQPPSGMHFVLIAVQAANHSAHTLYLSRSAFAISGKSRRITPIGFYPGHAGPFGVHGVASGDTMEGTLVFVLPVGAVPRMVRYTSVGRRQSLTWSL